MAATDARFVPIRNTAYRVYFPILDADGDPVTAATGLDAEVSKDGAAFADCTNESTEIGTSGIYYLDLTSTEMDADCVIVRAQTSTSGAKTTPIILYTASRDIDDLAFPTTSGRSIDVTATGEVGVDLDNTAGTLDAAQFGANFLTAAKIDPDVTTELQSGLATAAALATVDDFLDTEIAAIKAKTDNLPAAPAAVGDIPTAGAVADAVWDEATTGHTTSGTFGEQLKTDVDAILVDTAEIGAAGAGLTALASQASVNTIDDLLDTEVAAIKADTAAILADTGTDGVVVASIANGAITAGTIAADAIGASELAADAVTEIANAVPSAASIADAVWDEATAGHTTSGTFGEQAKTDVDAILAAVDTEVASIVTSLSTISGYLDTEVASILAAVDTEVAAIKAKTDLLPAAPAATGDIPTANAVRDAILAGTIDELSGVPAASPTLEEALAFLFMALRNKVTTSTTQTKIHNDAGTAIATAGVSDSGALFTRDEYA